jgi:hypothetical protein
MPWRDLGDCADGLTLMAKRRKAKTIEDVPWPPLDWEPPPLREDELTALEGELAKLDQLNAKPNRSSGGRCASQDAEREVQIRNRPADDARQHARATRARRPALSLGRALSLPAN